MSALSSAISTRARAAPVAGGTGSSRPASPSSSSSGSHRSASCRYGSAADTGNGSAPRSAEPAGRRSVPKGRRTVRTVPSPSVLSAVMVPPCRPTSSFTSASPMPLPSFERARAFSMRWNRSNSRGSSSRGTPMPVSDTRSTACPPSARSVTPMEPSKVNFSALLSRLRTTFSHMSRSMWTGPGSAGQSTSKSRPARSTAERKTLASSAVTAARSTGSKRARIRPASMREKSSRVLTSLPMRSALRRMTSSSPPTLSPAPASCPRSSSSGPVIRVSGVRNSWLMLEKNAVLARSSSASSSALRCWTSYATAPLTSAAVCRATRSKKAR